MGGELLKRKFNPLFETITFPNGVELNNRLALSSIVTNSSTARGQITEEDLAYAERRSKSAELVITGAAYIEPIAQRFKFGHSASSARDIPGLTKLAQSIQKDGAKGILQLVHSGRHALQALKDYGFVYGVSEKFLNYPFDHKVLELSSRKILDIIEYYGDATRRAIRAGFSGVEITGGNRYLIQHFFSKATNLRTDEYGYQSLENRSRFALAVVQEVQRVIDEEASDDFILGYRITPEEVQGENVGYTIQEMRYLIDELLEQFDIDYIATAMWGKSSYKDKVRIGKRKSEHINKVINEYIDGRALLMVNGGVNSPDKAVEALQFGDIATMATGFVTEPEFLQKIKNEQEENIDLSLTPEKLDNLKIPKYAFKDISYLFGIGKSLPKETREFIDKL